MSDNRNPTPPSAGSGADPAGRTTARCLSEGRIISVEFLESGRDVELTANTKQWVNLPRTGQWVDGHYVTNRLRVSQFPPFKVRFDRSGNHPFRARLIPGASNSRYTPNELARNARFGHQRAPMDFITNSDGTKIVNNFMVSVAGGDTYSIEAEDCHGNIVHSHEIKTWRLVYYIKIVMDGVRSFDEMTEVEAEFERHKIKLVHLTTANITHIPLIPAGSRHGREEFDAFIDSVRTAYGDSIAPHKESYVLALCFVDQIGRKRQDFLLETDGPVRIGDRTQPTVDIEVPRYWLWTQLAPGENQRDAWFVRAEYFPPRYIPDPENGRGINIDPELCTMVSHQRAMRNDVVTVRVAHLNRGIPSEARIKLWVNVLTDFPGGIAFDSRNLICCATRAEWGPMNSEKQKNIFIHEIGHAMGMVPSEEGYLPDRTDSFYDGGVDHQGPHCHYGISSSDAMRARNESDATCVMFGRAVYRNRSWNQQFCELCTPALLKVDLSRGWESFQQQ